MEITLHLLTRPVSINMLRIPVRMRGTGSVRLITNPNRKQGINEVERALSPRRHELEAFGRKVDRKKHGIEMDYEFHYPHAEFFTKAGLISYGPADVDNSFKVIKDKIFEIMGLNDGIVTRVVGEKFPIPKDCSQVPFIIVRMRVKEISA